MEGAIWVAFAVEVVSNEFLGESVNLLSLADLPSGFDLKISL